MSNTLVTVAKLSAEGAPLRVSVQGRLASPPTSVANRITDTWNEPRPVECENPYFAELQVTKNTRYLIECPEEASLRLMNWSTTKDVRVRVRNTADGGVSNVTVMQPHSFMDYPDPTHVIVSSERGVIIEGSPE